MRSIRLSLIVYFLALVAVALGAASGLAYRTVALALEERRLDARDLIEAQYENHRRDLWAALDRRLLRQARTIASTARTVSLHYESLYPFGVLGAVVMPEGYLSVPLWLAEGTHPPLMFQLAKLRPQAEIDVGWAEDLVLRDQLGEPLEYFQLNRSRGQPLLRSESLGERTLPLDRDLVRTAETFQDHYDTFELEPGLRLRRLTLKTKITRHHTSAFPWLWRAPLQRGGGGPRRSSPGGFQRPFSMDIEAPDVFVQYATNLAPLEAELAQFADERDRQLAELDESTRRELRDLRMRLVWIILLTFAAIVVGGYFLVRLGLAPLARLSEAVSQVTAKDFRLKVDGDRLPVELQPIAERLSQTFDQLQKAFDREKQAAADISHELRTPLAALLTTIEVALKRTRSAEEYQEVLEECRESGRQMSLLVERLLTLARLDAGAERSRARPTDVSDLALQCADLVRPLAQVRGIALRTDVEPNLVMQADPDKLREVLTNLLHNAIEYNRPDGSIDLGVRRDNGHLLLEVRDTGIGITPEHLPRIFERFYRADPSRHADSPHAGLGLAIVKSYVELLGGTVAVQSGPAGSTFRVRLPVAADAKHAIQPALA